MPGISKDPRERVSLSTFVSLDTNVVDTYFLNVPVFLNLEDGIPHLPDKIFREAWPSTFARRATYENPGSKSKLMRLVLHNTRID